MPFTIDTTNPTDTSIVAAFPANERGHRLNMEDILEVDHDIASGRHIFTEGTTAARDAITDWPVGAIFFNTDWRGMERVKSIGPVVWEAITQAVSGTDAGKSSLTNVPTGVMYVGNDSGLVYYYNGTGWVLINGTDPLSTHHQRTVATHAQENFAAVNTWQAVGDGAGDLEASVTVPAVGNWMVEVTGLVNVTGSANSGNGHTFYAGVQEDINAGATVNDIRCGGIQSHGNSDGSSMGLEIFYRNVSLTNNVVYKYKLLAATSSLDPPVPDIVASDASKFSQTSPGTVSGSNCNWIDVILRPIGS